MNDHNCYQDSGFEWIGEIPNDWTLSRAGKFFTERSEKVDDVTYPPLSVTMSGIVDQLSDVAKTSDGENRKLVKKYDFVINSRSDRKGSSGIAPRDGSVSLINIVLEPHDIDPQFIQHLFKSYYFKEEFFRNGKGIHWDLWTTRWDQFKNINIPIPSHREQRLISRYLDTKTSQIDSLINKIEKKIELLKEQRTSLINQYVTKGLDPNVEMKDSGVEWIGEIPKHWEFRKLKHFFSYKKGAFGQQLTTTFLTDNAGEYPVYSGQTENFGILGKWDNHEFDFKNGVIFCTTVGAKLMTTRVISGKFSLSQNCLIMIPKNESINSEYINYFFDFDFKIRRELLPTILQPSLRMEDLDQYWIPVPPVSEQMNIINKINSILNRSDQVTSNLVKKISLLKEYRQSLISSAVTGKVRIKEELV